MLFLYGDESNTPGQDHIWAIGALFTSRPEVHMQKIAELKKSYRYNSRELKYSSTDYSQVLCATKLIDYFLDAQDLYFKILIKDNTYFSPKYFTRNSYDLARNDMCYVASYSELIRSIKPTQYGQSNKLVNIDDKGFRGNTVLPKFLKQKDDSIVNVYRRNSKRRKRDGSFTGVSHMLQLADFLTGVILSFADTHRLNPSQESKKHKNIYRLALSARCNKIKDKCLSKQNYYWPSFQNQKINIFYWRQKNASLNKSPSKS